VVISSHMVIDIHPDAATRFDELAAGLLTHLRSHSSVQSAETSFRPNVYPVAHIRSKKLSATFAKYSQ